MTKEEYNLKQKEYYLLNRDILIQKKKERYLKNKDKISEERKNID